jgi:hypothetical protein
LRLGSRAAALRPLAPGRAGGSWLRKVVHITLPKRRRCGLMLAEGSGRLAHG